MQRRCSDRSGIPVRPVVAGQAGGETNEGHPGRTRWGRRTQGCSRVGRSPRTPSIDVETKEEQQIVDRKKLGQKESKKIKVILIWSIGFPNRPWPFIFIRWGRLTSQEIMFTDLNLLRTLIVLGLLLDRSDRSDLPVRPVGHARPSTDAQTGQTAWTHRLDRSVQVTANFGRQHMPPCSLAKLACQRTLL